MLSRPRYRPLLSVLVDSEVRGTTLQKLIVKWVSEVSEVKWSEVSEVSEVSDPFLVL